MANTSGEDSSSSGGGSSSEDEEQMKLKMKKLKKKIKKEQRKAEKSLKKKLKKQKKKAKMLKEKRRSEVAAAAAAESPIPKEPAPPPKEETEEKPMNIPIRLMEKSKIMAPMSKEEWEKRQSVVRKVLDEESGRYRLIKGDGEVLEELVPLKRHKEINQQATQADGAYFQAVLSKAATTR